MSASTNDKITDTRNAARPSSTTASGTRAASGTSLACTSLTGWPTASKVHFVTYQIDSNSNPVAGTQLDCYGIVSGNTIGSFTVVDGTDNGNSVGDVVEMLPTAGWGQDLSDALLIGHTRAGAHVSGLPLTSPTLTTPVIADFTSATHTHVSNAQGGTLGFSALTSSIFSGQVTTQANAGSAGGTMYYINLGGIKLCWGTTATQTIGGAAPASAEVAVTLPTSFFSTVQTAIATGLNVNQASIYAYVQAGTATTSSLPLEFIMTVGTAGQYKASFLVIGT